MVTCQLVGNTIMYHNYVWLLNHGSRRKSEIKDIAEPTNVPGVFVLSYNSLPRKKVYEHTNYPHGGKPAKRAGKLNKKKHFPFTSHFRFLTSLKRAGHRTTRRLVNQISRNIVSHPMMADDVLFPQYQHGPNNWDL